jgi:hypothetical protein
MAEVREFRPVKLICGIISSQEAHFEAAEERLISLYGAVDSRSPRFDFRFTDYYEPQMGKGLKRSFLSFERLVAPERLSEIKVRTNRLEEDIRGKFGGPLRIVNIDPGYITSAALIMATAKDFSHRIPLQLGIYAHLEFLFGKGEIRLLDWTYPDFAQAGYRQYFLEVRKIYLAQLKLLRRRPATGLFF